MKQYVGYSVSGKLSEAVKGVSNPDLLILFVTDVTQFQARVEELENMFPGVESIGCVAQGYAQKKVVENGLMVTAFFGVKVKAGVLTSVSTMPVKKIHEFEKAVNAVGGKGENTVCIDFCCANDEAMLTTIYSVLSKKGISVTGGTTGGGFVSCNGKVYEDACAYAIVKNEGGRVKVYKENLYQPTDKRFLVTKSIPSQYVISELDGRPAETVYLEELDIKSHELSDQTFTNPLGHIVGDDIFIVSVKESMGDRTFSCYRKVNPKTNLCILQIGDVPSILDSTINTISQDFSKISGVFSTNCIFRYLYFQKIGFVDTYLDKMGRLGTHAGMIGFGEHFNGHHTNQTMSCVVFE